VECGGGVFDAERLLGQMLRGALSGSGGRRRRGLAGGTGMQLGLGAVGIAIAAFEHFTQQRPAAGAPPAQPVPPAGGPQPPPPPPPPVAPLPAATAADATVAGPGAGHVDHDDAVLLIRGMIAAAAADGRIDEAEQARILDRLVEGGLDREARAFLVREMATPADAMALVERVPPRLADAFFAATLLAIDVDHAAEREHLDRVAAALSLSATDRARIEASLG
jgi:uncharacterized membrane protein YebE (DUF533 family)